MPFSFVETVNPSKIHRASISYRKRRSKNGGSKPPVLMVGIPKTVAGNFKPQTGQRFGVFIGDGKDGEGKARIQPTNKEGGAIPKRLRGGYCFCFGFVPMLGEDQAEKEFIDVKPCDDGFEITLPAWFKADNA